MGTEYQHMVEVYQAALNLWQQKRLVEAEQMLQGFWQQSGMRSLRGILLMAYIMREQKRYISEIKFLRDAVESFSDSGDNKLLADVWSMLGSALRQLGECELSVEAFKKSVEVEPDKEQKLVECSNALFSANAIDGVSAEYMQPLYALYRSLLADLAIVPYPASYWQHEKIRIGYLSADLWNHAVGQFVHPLFCQYDKERFSVYGYSLVQHPDGVTAVLRQGCDTWREVLGCSWAEIARQIRADEIDVLVDLAGHSAENALPVFAYRPAPVQISGIGYFNSTGMQEMQGFLSDGYCSPEDRSPYFTEKLLRLPHSHFCYQPFAKFPEVGQPPCLDKGYVTFGCFNNFAKVTDSMLLLWKEILQRLPDSNLLLKHSLLGTADGLAYTRQRFERLGMPLERIEFRGLSKDYLEQYQDMDIALDTSPYTGGLTTCEALYMGVPVVTIKGNRHGARFGYSFLSNLGLQELAAHDGKSYVDIAVTLAEDTELLVLLRQKLRPMMQASPLMDSDAYMRGLEALYQRMLERVSG